MSSQVRSLRGEESLEEEMAAHSGILAWKIPWTEKPGGLQSMRSQRVGHDWSYLAHSTYLHRPSPRVPENLTTERFCPTETLCWIPFQTFPWPSGQPLSITALAWVGKGHSQSAWLCLPSILPSSPAWFLVSYGENQLRDPNRYYF